MGKHRPPAQDDRYHLDEWTGYAGGRYIRTVFSCDSYEAAKIHRDGLRLKDCIKIRLPLRPVSQVPEK